MLAYRTIIVGVDFSVLAQRGLNAALTLANAFGARRLHLVHVVHTAAPLPILPELSDESRLMALAEERLQALPIPECLTARITRQVRRGSPARELAMVAHELHADLLVVASRGQGSLARLVLGSVSSTLIRVSPCPVLVVNDRDVPDPCFERVLAAVDLSPISFSVLHHACSVAHACRAQVDALSLYEDPSLVANLEGLLPQRPRPEAWTAICERQREEVERLLALLPKDGVEVNVEVPTRASAPQAIVEAARAQNADLVVMGTSGRNAWHHMILGSTANHVLEKAPCPVLVVPPEARVPLKETREALRGMVKAES